MYWAIIYNIYISEMNDSNITGVGKKELKILCYMVSVPHVKRYGI